MANKSVISIDIDDRQFASFLQLFNTFQDKLGELPEDWKRVNEASHATGQALAGAMGALVESMVTASGHAKSLSEHLRDASDAQKQFGTATRQSESGLKKMASEAKELGESIFGIGKFLFKIGAIGIGAGVGALFGIDKLSESAVSNQRAARTLGLTTGQFRAFDTDLGRNVGNNTLQNVVNAQHSISGQIMLSRATGLSQEQLAGMDAGSISAVLAMRENAYIKANPGWNMQTIGAQGFTQLGESQSDLLLHGNAPLSEQQRAYRQYQSDSRSLNYGDGTVDALYDFSNRLRMAGQHIETDLSDKLSELNRNGALSAFITNLEKDAELLINGALTPNNLKSLQDGLTSVATYLGSGDFKQDVKEISEDIGMLASAMKWAAGEIKKIIHPDPNTPEGKIHQALGFMHNASAKVTGAIGYVLGKDVDELGWVKDKLFPNRNNPGNLRSAPGVPSVGGFAKFASINDGYAAMASLLQSYPSKHHADTLSSIINTYAPSSDHNNVSAYIADVMKQTGFKADQKLNLNDPQVLLKLLAAMVKHENGTKISPQQIAQDISQSTWGSNSSNANLKQLIAAISRQNAKGTTVVVKNNAGANVAISTNAAAVQ